MIEVYNTSEQVIDSDNTVNLGSIKIQVGENTGYENTSGHSGLKLVGPGVYKICVNGSVLGTSDVELDLVDNSTNTIVNGGQIIIDGLVAGNLVFLPFNCETLIHVGCSCCCVNNNKTIVLKNNSTESITINNINVIVTKVI